MDIELFGECDWFKKLIAGKEGDVEFQRSCGHRRIPCPAGPWYRIAGGKENEDIHVASDGRRWTPVYPLEE